jgi:hypothetical protein
VLDVLDVGGRRVARLDEGWRAPGTFETTWRGRADGGGIAASGVYLVRLASDERSDTERLVWIR